MLCSLDELGWIQSGPDQVALRQGVETGERLDGVLGWSKVLSPIQDECAEATDQLLQTLPDDNRAP